MTLYFIILYGAIILHSMTIFLSDVPIFDFGLVFHSVVRRHVLHTVMVTMVIH